MPPGTGIWLNNSLQYCTFEPKGNPMDAHAGRRKLSGDCPTIVMKNGRPWAALGTPGGHTIGQTVPQIVSSTVRTAGPSGSGAPPTRGVGEGEGVLTRRGTVCVGVGSWCLVLGAWCVLGAECLVRAWCFVPGAESADGLSALTRTRHQALSTHPAPSTQHAPSTKHSARTQHQAPRTHQAPSTKHQALVVAGPATERSPRSPSGTSPAGRRRGRARSASASRPRSGGGRR